MTADPIRVLFVCTGNSARSISAEALLRHVGGARFEAHSAGTHPTTVHPDAVRALERAGIDTAGLRSKSLDRYRDMPFDDVITPCDEARTVCPVFPGADQSLHWGYGDPASAEGTDSERLVAFEQVLARIAERVRQFAMVAGRWIRPVDVVEA